MTDFVLGVDGGNTKSLGCIARSDGTIVGYARGVCSDIYAYPSADMAIAEISRIVDEALAMAGLSRDAIQSACFSLAGADWQEDYDDLNTMLRAENLGRQQTIVNDAIGALRAGSPDGTGIVVACGTGAVVAARKAEGQFWHSSFWQEPMCGRTLANLTLRAVYRAELGIDPPTALTEGVLEFFDLPTVEAVLHRLNSRIETPPPFAHLAKLTVVLMDAAQQGDATALAICHDHGIKLGEYACVAAHKVGLDASAAIPLVFLGGVLRHVCPVIRQTAADYVRQSYPQVETITHPLEPVAGAVLLALEAAQITVTDTVRDNLVRTLPSSEFFHTAHRPGMSSG